MYQSRHMNNTWQLLKYEHHCFVYVLPSCENEPLKVRCGGEYMSITLQDLKKQKQSTLLSHTIIITEIHKPVEK